MFALNPVNSAIIVLAGGAAGFMNSIVGSGTLLSFPTLVGLGVAETTANISNGAGLTPGSVSAVAAQRPELVGQRQRILKLAPASFFGAVVGAILLLKLPSKSFKKIVPFLIFFAVVLVLIGPTLQRKLRERSAARSRQPASALSSHELAPGKSAERIHPLLMFAVFLVGIYGGYFGAAQGVMLIGVLGIALDDSMARVNATKNVLSAIVNGVAGIVYALDGKVHWGIAALISVGSVIGGQLGARVGRKIQPNVLRGIVAVVGTVAATRLFLQ